MLPTSSVYSHILTCIVRVIFGFTRLSFMNIISKIYRLWHTKIVGFSIGCTIQDFLTYANLYAKGFIYCQK